MNIHVKVENLNGYLESRLVEEISLDLELLGIEGGKIEVTEDPDENQITYDLIPDDVCVTVWFTDDSIWQVWRGVIDTAGRVTYLIDTDGNQYHTIAALRAAGVKRFTLEPQHVVWIAD